MLTISTFENSKNNSKKEDKKEIVILSEAKDLLSSYGRQSSCSLSSGTLPLPDR